MIDSENEYASIVVVSLDGKPLNRSEQILIQVGTKARPTGWTVRERAIKNGETTFDGFQILKKVLLCRLRIRMQQ